MRSENADRFNHDDDAADYDDDVRDESDPIRAGYEAVLSHVAACVPADCGVVVDLGCGTGNLAARIERPRRLLGVDISDNMLAIARDKLAGRPFEIVRADLLECFAALPRAGAVVSTYAVHHLTSAEKTALFERCFALLEPGGVAAFGDLMFESRAAASALLAGYAAAGRQDLADAIADEYFWYLDERVGDLERLGFAVHHQRYSDLSWVVVAHKP